VEVERADQTEDALGHASHHSCDVGLGGQRVRRQVVDPATEPFQLPGVTHPVERARLDARGERLGGAQNAVVPLEGFGRPGDRLLRRRSHA